MADTTTLRQVLTQKKPPVRCYVEPGPNTAAPAPNPETNKTWPTPTITIWDEFSLANLNESYGHILDRPTPAACLPCPQANQELSGLSIEVEHDVRKLIGWNNALMGPALQLAASRLELYTGRGLYYSHSTAEKNKSNNASLLDQFRSSQVDHVIGLDDFPVHHFVVGFGRSSSKWIGRALAAQRDNPTMNLLLPVRQLANICRAAKTRYGYVQTDKEVVVCCFSRDDSDRWKAAIMPIPWSRHGPEVLTTDLALWWLCMLAMSSPDNRAIVAEGDMVKINEWAIVHLGEGRGWARRHRYSNLEVSTDSPAPSVPLPGNHALPQSHDTAGSKNKRSSTDELDVNVKRQRKL